ncbi:unnamed protein product [Alopecurus aequalis]
MVRELQDPRNLVPVQILVLFSLGIQVVLFLCAGARRKETSSSLRMRIWVLWLAYNLGDGLATFTLSRLAFFSAAGSHPLMVLWAPFLLLHLAGPDNIAAYALQDNQLSLRSLYIFFARIIAGVYFLYAYRNSSGDFIGLASRLVSAVAVVKYWERWLALKRGNLGSIRDSLKQKKPPPAMNFSHVHPHDVKFEEGSQTLDEESSVRRAHSLFHICKCGMVDSSEDKPGRENYMNKMDHSEYWTIAEMELSLMYDILYTKAAVIHTWHGYTIRVISPLAISASLLLFHFSGEDMRHREDTAMTYVLFGSALFMEWTSLLNALGSSWMLATRSPWLRYHYLCSGRWDRLRRLVISLNPLVTCGGSRSGARRWSGNMGQYNMLHFCTRPDDLLTRPLLGRLAELVGFGEWWNRKHFSGAANISDHVQTIKVCINNQIHEHLYREWGLSSLGLITHRWGMATLVRHKLLVDNNKFERTLGKEFQEGIIIWHVGPDFFLSRCKSTADHEDLVNAVKALSNYMLFLLVERPYMLPGIAQNRLYERTCEALVERPYMLPGVSHHPRSLCAMLKSLFRWRDGPAASYTSRATQTKIRADNLYQYFEKQKFSYDTVRLTYSARVANELLRYEYHHDTTKSLNVVLEVWTDMLVYAGNRGSRESHAKKLSSGGELTTIMWLMVEHFHQASLEVDDKKASDEEASSKEEYHDNYTV